MSSRCGEMLGYDKERDQDGYKEYGSVRMSESAIFHLQPEELQKI